MGKISQEMWVQVLFRRDRHAMSGTVPTFCCVLMGVNDIERGFSSTVLPVEERKATLCSPKNERGEER